MANQVVLPEYYLIFLPETRLFEKFWGGGGFSPPQPHVPYAYDPRGGGGGTQIFLRRGCAAANHEMGV